MVNAETLRRYSHFSQLDPEALKKLADMADEVTATAGQAIFSEPDPAEYLYLIVHGKIQLACPLGSGEFRVVDSLTDGELVGWTSLVEPYRCRTYATAVTDTQLIRFNATRLRKLCESEHGVGQRLLTQIARMLSSRLKHARAQLAAV